VGIRVRKMVAVGHLVHKYDEIICSIHQGGHPASHHDPPVGGPWWGSFAKTTGVENAIPNQSVTAAPGSWAYVRRGQPNEESDYR
jgi:hypothetical protein